MLGVLDIVHHHITRPSVDEKENQSTMPHSCGGAGGATAAPPLPGLRTHPWLGSDAVALFGHCEPHSILHLVDQCTRSSEYCTAGVAAQYALGNCLRRTD